MGQPRWQAPMALVSWPPEDRSYFLRLWLASIVAVYGPRIVPSIRTPSTLRQVHEHARLIVY